MSVEHLNDYNGPEYEKVIHPGSVAALQLEQRARETREALDSGTLSGLLQSFFPKRIKLGSRTHDIVGKDVSESSPYNDLWEEDITLAAEAYVAERIKIAAARGDDLRQVLEWELESQRNTDVLPHLIQNDEGTRFNDWNHAANRGAQFDGEVVRLLTEAIQQAA